MWWVDDKDIDWGDALIHASISLAVGCLMSGLPLLTQVIHLGWLVRESIQRVQKEQPQTRLVRSKQVLLEWVPPLITGLIGYLAFPVHPILSLYRIFTG